jgi:hypothetical protein
LRRARGLAWPGYRLVEERHREVAQVEQPGVDAPVLLQLLHNPVRGLSEKRPSRVLPTMTEMTVMLLLLAY